MTIRGKLLRLHSLLEVPSAAPVCDLLVDICEVLVLSADLVPMLAGASLGKNPLLVVDQEHNILPSSPDRSSHG